ncbi:uncharacterized protein LOC110505637 [Oncorhynchus mykiss]|uniref:uncharacterized protein LOC110505637 n=1 Tax=Oncorhynchus mykiss TaxID=8022 RepID=UPI0018789C4A|nr:uncharacterized protein LOC110505637 [Oncorhynchus mykiss]
MMLAVCVTVVLGLLSVSGSQAAPLTCEDLLRPLELSSVNQTLGKWVYIAESSDRPFWEQILYTLLHSAWIEVSVPVGTQNNILDIAQFHGFGIPYQNTFGFGCSRINSNFTLHDNSTWTSVSPIPVTEVLLTTCSECLLTLEKWGEDGKTYTSLTLYSRRRELTATELDFYKKQVDCLSLPPATFIDPKKDLCLDTTPLLEDQIAKEVENAGELISEIPRMLRNAFEELKNSVYQPFSDIFG